MGDYRYQITEHHDTQCLHVIVEHDESDELHKAGMAHTYIPVDDIQKSIEQYSIQRMQNELLEAGIEAIKVLRGLMNDPKATPNMRLQCAKIIQGHAGRTHNTVSVPEVHIEIPKLEEEQAE